MICWACEIAPGEKKCASSRIPLLAAWLGAAAVNRSRGVKSRRKLFLVKVIVAPFSFGDVGRPCRGRLRGRLRRRGLGEVFSDSVPHEFGRGDDALIIFIVSERRDQDFHQLFTVFIGEGLT